MERLNKSPWFSDDTPLTWWQRLKLRFRLWWWGCLKFRTVRLPRFTKKVDHWPDLRTILTDYSLKGDDDGKA